MAITPAEIVGLKLWEIGALVDKGKSLQAFADLQDNCYVHYGDLPLLTKAGKSIAVEFVSNVYSVGEAMVIQCNIRDISERKRAERLQQDYDNAVLAGLSGIVNALASVLETRDPYTSGHTHRVADLAEAIGRELRLDPSTTEGLRISALVNDIGKIAIPAELLTKPTALSVWEMALIKSHVEVGYEVLSEIDFPWLVAKAVRQHHERLDGSGYLQGLEGEAIILEARILAVADTVEAMTTNRPYRFAKGLVEAMWWKLAWRCSGKRTTPSPNLCPARVAVLAELVVGSLCHSFRHLIGQTSKNPGLAWVSRMEPSGFEPLTPCMPCRCSTS